MSREADYASGFSFLYDNERLSIKIHPVDRTGSIVLSEELFEQNNLLLQTAQEQDSEKVQIILADAAKLYSFGRQHRFFTYTGKLLDTNLFSPIPSEEMLWTGRGYSEFTTFFEEEASLSACAEKRQLVGLYYAGRAIYGAINNLSIVANATTPHEYDVVFTFFVSNIY